MGIWVRKPELAESETVQWQRNANRTQSANRAVGGRLFLTSARLVFEPNRLDAASNGRQWSTPLGNIRAVGVEQSNGNMFNGGLRKRLRLDLADGSVELFVVNGLLDSAISVIREAAARGAGAVLAGW